MTTRRWRQKSSCWQICYSGCSIGATAKWRDPSSGVGIQRTGAGGGLNASHLDRTSEQVKKASAQRKEDEGTVYTEGILD